MEIKYFNRGANQVEKEVVYGEKAIEWLYKSRSGKLLSSLVAHPLVSLLYGFFQDSPLSRKKVIPFIKKFNIKMDEFLHEEGREELSEAPYSNFNQFFIRRFKVGKRKFNQDPNILSAFSEARYFGYESINDSETVPVKGTFLSPKYLLGKSKWAKTFNEGPLLIARLCPVDYHRFHYPDNGKIIETYRQKGQLHSVNPLALSQKNDIFVTNERVITILETEHFGKLAYIEVGATCVGKIIQTAKGKIFSRGDEKGYFLFGGSTVIVIGERGKWTPSFDILENTKNAREVYIQLGDEVGTAL